MKTTELSEDSPSSPSELQPVLKAICSARGHQFWPDSISLRDRYPTLHSFKQLINFYLLTLAIQHKERLATFGRRIDPFHIPDGEKAYLLIP